MYLKWLSSIKTNYSQALSFLVFLRCYNLISTYVRNVSSFTKEFNKSDDFALLLVNEN